MNRKTLTDCVQSYIDNRGITPKKLKGDFADGVTKHMVLSANNVKSKGLVKLSEVRYVNDDLYTKWMAEDIQKGDILLTSEAPAGEVLYWDSDEKVVVGQRLYALRTNTSVVDSLYLSYYLKSPKGQTEINKNLTGSTVFGISQKTFDNIMVDLPNMDRQLQIGKILKAIDDKIANNNAINAELEAMAKTIYDYWFLQFEFPDENGKPYKSSGGKMIYNEELKREIPEYWEATNIGTITECLDARRIPVSSKDRETKRGDIPYYGATGIMDYVDEALFDGDYVLVAEDGSVMDSNGNPILQRITGKTWVNNHAHVLKPVKGYDCKLLMLLLKDVQVSTIKTGSIQMKINQAKMNSIAIPDIPTVLLKQANAIFNQIDQYQLLVMKENQELATLRDFLLPLLMNGQVGFKEDV